MDLLFLLFTLLYAIASIHLSAFLCVWLDDWCRKRYLRIHSRPQAQMMTPQEKKTRRQAAKKGKRAARKAARRAALQETEQKKTATKQKKKKKPARKTASQKDKVKQETAKKQKPSKKQETTNKQKLAKNQTPGKKPKYNNKKKRVIVVRFKPPNTLSKVKNCLRRAAHQMRIRLVAPGWALDATITRAAHISHRDGRRHITYHLRTVNNCSIGPLHEPFSEEEETALVELIKEELYGSGH